MNFSDENIIKHVTGESVFIDDIPIEKQLLYGKVVYSRYAHAEIKSYNLSEAHSVPGVRSILTYKDILGHNQMGPVIHDEPCLAKGEVNFIGQAIFLIAADSEDTCHEAEKKIKIKYKLLEPILNMEDAIQKQNILLAPTKIERGDIEDGFKKSKYIFNGKLKTGEQEHWYLETQIALCIPGEREEMCVYSSTQHPSETQALVAEVLGISKNKVVVETRRLGGAFGGKETQANHIACWAALLANATRKPVKLRLERDDDQKMTGKRHPFLINYKTGFDDDGKICALDIEYNCDGGSSLDLTRAILERAMLHADNSYFIPNIRVIGKAWKTNLPSNTAFRGFGGPQGMAGIENILDRIAGFLQKDPLLVRKINFYGTINNNYTHYNEKIENNKIHIIYKNLIKTSDYLSRRKEINLFNKKNIFTKKGLAITPVKFGISFTTSFLNQAGALVNVYKDGSVMVNHGGVEMGQGLNSKIQQVAAKEFGLSLEKINLTPTNTSKVPNTSATAASSGTDLNGMAVKNAIDKLKNRISLELVKVFNERFNGVKTLEKNIVFKNNLIYDKKCEERIISFADAMNLLYIRQVSLSATGFYKTPGIFFNKETGQGKPFHYFAFGMCVSEVEVDTLTGIHKVMRADILHDVGESLNPEIDMGQIVGGFIQGIGWCTMEEIKRDKSGNLLTYSPGTYKIPAINDLPLDLRVKILKNSSKNNTIGNSKAVGEPPFMLALSVWCAIKDAISACGENKYEPDLNIPATAEQILFAIEKIRK